MTSDDTYQAADIEDWDQPYRSVDGHTRHRVNPTTTWDAVCTEDCDACHGTGPYADEPWYNDGMM